MLSRDDLASVISNLSQALHSLEGLEGLDFGVDEAAENVAAAHQTLSKALESEFPVRYSRDTW